MAHPARTHGDRRLGCGDKLETLENDEPARSELASSVMVLGSCSLKAANRFR
jgi:hypothetical protein